MRAELKKYENQTLTFTGKFSCMARKGRKALFHYLSHNNKIISDHVWISVPNGLMLKSRCIYSFSGKVKKYFKPVEEDKFDYTILYPSNFRIVIERI